MRERDNVDVWAAVTIGAIVGIGAALLFRARQEDDTREIIKRLRPVRRGAERAAKVVRREVGRRAHQAGEAGEELISASRDVLEDIREGARDIVRTTRNELRKAARDSVKEARKAAQRAARQVGR
jgi:gas vesicle protein